jgi:hypothetical protein
MRYRPRFSIGWCIFVAVLHAAGTIGLCLLNFLSGMSSFTYGDSNQGDGLLWIWTPLAMSAWNPEDGSNEGTLLFLGLLWSAIIGTIAGLLIPFLRRNKAKPDIGKFSHSDVAGTPWANDPNHVSSRSKRP